MTFLNDFLETRQTVSSLPDDVAESEEYGTLDQHENDIDDLGFTDDISPRIIIHASPPMTPTCVPLRTSTPTLVPPRTSTPRSVSPQISPSASRIRPQIREDRCKLLTTIWMYPDKSPQPKSKRPMYYKLL
ncbi:hypothetical protein ACS0PU_011383 [Formica fusca]